MCFVSLLSVSIVSIEWSFQFTRQARSSRRRVAIPAPSVCPALLCPVHSCPPPDSWRDVVSLGRVRSRGPGMRNSTAGPSSAPSRSVSVDPESVYSVAPALSLGACACATVASLNISARQLETRITRRGQEQKASFRKREELLVEETSRTPR